MGTVKVTAPAEGYAGTGPGGAVFLNGVAEVDDTQTGALAYYREHGYGVAGDEPTPPDGPPAQPDSREVGGERQIGTRLRDAAVDPVPDDYLAPVGAGEHDPHGPQVVAPGIHAAVDASPLVPGPVLPPREQEPREKDAAAAVLRDGADVGTVTGPDGPLVGGEPNRADAIDPATAPVADDPGDKAPDVDPEVAQPAPKRRSRKS